MEKEQKNCITFLNCYEFNSIIKSWKNIANFIGLEKFIIMKA